MKLEIGQIVFISQEEEEGLEMATVVHIYPDERAVDVRPLSGRDIFTVPVEIICENASL